ncbi:flagellar protein FliT [Metabacillus bambusae]|uniref:Flagellar protein FliT n=1 Tax=Metabacillus bambusae TaxID=2795218 RepID=A0ABS3N0D6_9BACI|nr:flagellar protein FliT [Metabacillus bambusae]MBO1511728.1 flagellar protein FliT [Metabacillus bambusae]
MNAVKQVYDMTKELVDISTNEIEKEDRENVINNITELLEQRDLLIKEMKPPFTQNEKKLGQQIILWNEQLSASFVEIKKRVQVDIAQLKKTRTSTNKYINPYQNTTIDGMYYDKRK